MKSIALAFLLASVMPTTSSATQAQSGYSGQQTRDIKALSRENVEGLLAGKGLGFAKAAELNRYPGPAHVLELAKELQLTDAEVQSTRAIHAQMEGRAKEVGARVVAAEMELEQLFQSHTVTEASLTELLGRLGSLQAELRGVHLIAHVQQQKLLSPEQIASYVNLRGYHSGHSTSGHAH